MTTTADKGVTSDLVLQVMIVSVSTVMEPPSAELRQPVLTERYVERLCRLPLGGVVAALCYNVLLVLVCTVLAFKTRRLPDNYNESRYIAFCVDTTLLVWLTFVPAYFTAALAAHKVVVLALALLLNSSVHLACLFLPRLYTLFRVMRGAPPSETKRCTCSYGQIPLQRTSALEVGGSFTSDVAGSTNEMLVSNVFGAGSTSEMLLSGGFRPGGVRTQTISDHRDARFNKSSDRAPIAARRGTTITSSVPTVFESIPPPLGPSGDVTERRDGCRHELLTESGDSVTSTDSTCSDPQDALQETPTTHHADLTTLSDSGAPSSNECLSRKQVGRQGSTNKLP